MMIAVRMRRGIGPKWNIKGTEAAVNTPPPTTGSNRSCLYPKPSRAGDLLSGSAIFMSKRPLAVIPIDCPKLPMLLSNQYEGIILGPRSINPARFQNIPTNASMMKGIRLLPITVRDRVAMALVINISRERPCILIMRFLSRVWYTSNLSRNICRIMPPIIARGKRGM